MVWLIDLVLLLAGFVLWSRANNEGDEAHASAAEMLRKLNDFLSVPASIRPILTFDLDQLFDPQRFSDLERSFSEVVLLNDAFRQLSEDRLA